MRVAEGVEVQALVAAEPGWRVRFDDQRTVDVLAWACVRVRGQQMIVPVVGMPNGPWIVDTSCEMWKVSV